MTSELEVYLKIEFWTLRTFVHIKKFVKIFVENVHKKKRKSLNCEIISLLTKSNIKFDDVLLMDVEQKNSKVECAF